MPPARRPRRQLRRTFMREWREYRQLSQEQAAERLEMDRTNLSKIERGLVPYSQAVLESAAVAYSCDPWELLNVNPLIDSEVVDITQLLKEADDVQRAKILGYAEGVVRPGKAS